MLHYEKLPGELPESIKRYFNQPDDLFHPADLIFVIAALIFVTSIEVAHTTFALFIR